MSTLDGQVRAGHRRDARHRPRDRAGARPRRRHGGRHGDDRRGRREDRRVPRGGGQRGSGIALDVTDGAAVDAALADIEARFGAVTILVNNAGITRDNLLLRMKDDEWDAIMATNLKPVFRLAKAVLRGMMKARHGRIINIGSVVGASGNAGQANYAAAKAALVGFTKSLAQEVGSRNITVNCVAPGFIDTDMTRALPEAQRGKLLERIPLGRLGTPEDVAEAVVFLASPRAAYITGATLHVNGGMYMTERLGQASAGMTANGSAIRASRGLLVKSARFRLGHSRSGRRSMENIEQRVKKIVAEQLGVNEAEIKNESSFVDDLGADSLDTVELVMALEEEFETEIPDEEAEKITTVQQAIDYIGSHVKK